MISSNYLKLIFALILLLVVSSISFHKQYNLKEQQPYLQIQKFYPQQEQQQQIPDENTLANVLEVTTSHYHMDVVLDFQAKSINGTQTLYMSALQSGVKRVDLDILNIQVQSVYCGIKNIPLNFTVVPQQKPNETPGDQLQIFLQNTSSQGQQYIFIIQYISTNPMAASWLTPEQTASKTLPYLYTQCEPVYCRSLAPLQDTPYIKSTYSANITLPNPLNVFMSANLTATTPSQQYQNHTVYSFRQSIPIPSYLLTIVAGNVVQKYTGKRTAVISEPTFIDQYTNELSDLDLYLNTVENYTIPYIWGEYKVVILPPSFPFGGMENPLVTFASPSIIAGDKSGVSVAIHEIAHSWTGNYVTCKNWRNMWMNEGFTVYLERKADLILFGRDAFLVDAVVGNSTMVDDMRNFGFNHSYSSLYPVAKNVNPDDSFSTIPYEKGFQFLMYIESLVGESFLQELLRSYLRNFAFKSVEYTDFQNYFNTYVTQNLPKDQAQKVISTIDWKTWVEQPGLPPVTLNFTTPVINESKDLAQQYINLGGQSSPQTFQKFFKYDLNEKSIFLQYLFDNLDKLNAAILARIDSDYNVSNQQNKELLWRWFRVTIRVGFNQNKELIHQFLGSIGRLKMITPVYQALIESGQKALAQQYFDEYKGFYHPIAVSNISKLLNKNKI